MKKMKNLFALFMVAILMVGTVSILPSCAFIERQQLALQEMDDGNFQELSSKVFYYAQVGGEKLREKMKPEDRQYLEVALGIILSKNNQERGKMIAEMLKNEDYGKAVGLAMGAALDIVESVTGTKLDLSLINFTDREHVLLRALLEGVLRGLETPVGVTG